MRRACTESFCGRGKVWRVPNEFSRDRQRKSLLHIILMIAAQNRYTRARIMLPGRSCRRAHLIRLASTHATCIIVYYVPCRSRRYACLRVFPSFRRSHAKQPPSLAPQTKATLPLYYWLYARFSRSPVDGKSVWRGQLWPSKLAHLHPETWKRYGDLP